MPDQSAQNESPDGWGEESDGFESVEQEVQQQKKKVTSISVRSDEKNSRSEVIRQEHRDIVERARVLKSAGFIDYPDVKSVMRGNQPMAAVLTTDSNKIRVLDTVFGGAVVPKPHLDEFRGRIVDHRGRIIDDRYPVVEWVEMFRTAGIKGLTTFDTRRTLKEWSLARSWNDLIERVQRKIPAWDGVPRLDTYLVDLFEPTDTPFVRALSRYFWQSLYMRVMQPGCVAPVVLSLFGTQNCGKSWFGTRLTRIIMQDEKADSVQLDLGSDKVNFLREVTGNSIVAAVGEMTGFNRGDLNKIKDFVTRTSDKLHYKFEGHFDQMRQWVCVMDGNKYEGLQRDETGNRRFAPLFCGQIPDVNGQPAWREDFSKGAFIASQQFEDDVWQLMAEAAQWYEDNGDDAYNALASDMAKKTFAFSKNEMANDRGTFEDELVKPHIAQALFSTPVHFIVQRDRKCTPGALVDVKALIVKLDEIADRTVSHERGFRKDFNRLRDRLGAELAKRMVSLDEKDAKGRPKRTSVDAWRFDNVSNMSDLIDRINEKLGLAADEEYDEVFESKEGHGGF